MRHGYETADACIAKGGLGFAETSCCGQGQGGACPCPPPAVVVTSFSAQISQARQMPFGGYLSTLGGFLHGVVREQHEYAHTIIFIRHLS